MRAFSGLLCMAFAVSLAACSAPAQNNAAWTLNAGESAVSYVTIKQNSLGEVNSFGQLSGQVSPEGAAEIVVTLDSVDTLNETRDGRMREILFETGAYPTAKITATLDMAAFSDLAAGESSAQLIEINVDLHGLGALHDAPVLVTRLGANKVSVVTQAPVLLDAEEFGFEAGLAKLQELAGLDSITPVVPVTASLVFER